jgi:hypothetical protein
MIDTFGMVGMTRHGNRFLSTENKEKWSAGDGDDGRRVRSTTVLCVRKGEEVVMLADGQVTMGGSILKPNVKKTRKIGDKVMGGFAGATADAFTLFERLETKLEEHPSQLTRAAVELAKMWRMDKYLRRLDVRMCLLSSYCMVLWIGKSRTNWCKREINKQVKNYDVCRLPL